MLIYKLLFGSSAQTGFYDRETKYILTDLYSRKYRNRKWTVWPHALEVLVRTGNRKFIWKGLYPEDAPHGYIQVNPKLHDHE